MKILVTDGNSRAALAITRSLGGKGHEVHVTSNTQKSISACSRYCHLHTSYPDPTTDRDAFLNVIEDLVKHQKIDVLLPVTDVCVLPIAEERARFEPYCAVPLPDWESISRAADKNDITELAHELGVATPASITLLHRDSIDVRHLPIPFPLVIKPYRSRVRDGNGWIHTAVDYALTTGELIRKLDKLSAAEFPVLLQERVRGPGIGLFYCFDRGQPVATFAHRRIREKPPSGGVSVLRESVLPHRQADEFGASLLRKLNWHGVAMVEFKLDDRDQTPKLMEINGRFWGSLQLAIDAGVDFPDLLVRMAAGEEISPVEGYKLGLRSRWFWGEIDLLMMYLLKSRDELRLPEGHDSRLWSILKVLSPFVQNQKMEILRLSDIKPWFYESLHWFNRRHP